jgi:hypothetical protein
MSACEIVAALYVFSDLMDEVPEPSRDILREELSFVVTRYGTALIGLVAEWMTEASNSCLELSISEVGLRIDRLPSARRLAWCRLQAGLAFGDDDARRTA